MNLPEIRLLKQQSGLSDDALRLGIMAHQVVYGEDSLPTLAQLVGADSTNHIKEFLGLDESSSIQTEDLLQKTGTNSVDEAIQELNKIYGDKQITGTELNTATVLDISPRSTINGKLEDNFLIKEVQSKEYFQNQLQKLQKVRGLQTHVVNSADPVFQKIPQAITAKAFVYNGEIYLNTDLASVEDPAHELLHILLGGMRFENPQLYYELVDTVKQFSNYNSQMNKIHNRALADAHEEIFIQELAKSLTGQSSEFDYLPENITKRVRSYVLNTYDDLLEGNLSVKTVSDVFNQSIASTGKYVQAKSMQTDVRLLLDQHPDFVHRQLANKKSDLIKQGKLKQISEGRYSLGPKIFKSDFELDNFLLEQGDLYASLGDLVFDYTPDSSRWQKVIEDKVKKDAIQAREEGRKYYEAAKQLYGEDEWEANYKPPYYGVNKFLASLIQLSEQLGHRIYPEFIADSYWSERKSNWVKTGFNEAEMECFFDNDQAKADEALQKVKTESTALEITNTLREQMENKWKQQALVGTELHKVYAMYFDNVDAPKQFADYRKVIDPELVPDEALQATIDHAKALRTQFEDKFGKWGKLKYYTEMDVVAKLPDTIKGKEAKVLGIIDLFIIDGRGQGHIIDYKTSIKNYDKFGDPKKAAFYYQLAMYTKMLEQEKYGFNMRGTDVQMIAPIEIQGFKKSNKTWVDPDDKKTKIRWTYDKVIPYHQNLVDITSEIIKRSYIYDNLQKVFPTYTQITIQPNELILKMEDWINYHFPNYANRPMQDEEISKLIREKDGFKLNENGVMVFQQGSIKVTITPTNNSPEAIKKAETKMFREVKDRILGDREKRARLTQAVISELDKGLKDPDYRVSFKRSPLVRDDTGSVEWFSNTFERYLTDHQDYKILNLTQQSLQPLTDLGIIVIQNVNNNQLDFIKLSTNILFRQFKFDENNNLSMIGRSVSSDLFEQKKSDSLMTQAVYGNIELMEVMFVINNIASIFQENSDTKVGRIQVANPIWNEGISMSNEELLYTYKRLNDYKPVENDNILQEGSPIKFATRWQLFMNQLSQILTNDKTSKYSVLKTSQPDLEAARNPQAKIKQLKQFINAMKSIGIEMNAEGELQFGKTVKEQEIQLYNFALLALAELEGIKFRQQVEKYGEWFQNAKIWEKGFNSLKFDNPGHMNSDTLNLLAKLTMEWYQGVRDDLQTLKPQVEQHVKALKEAKDYSKFRALTVGNQARDLYKHMFRSESETDGDLILKNPWDETSELDPDERDFLKFWLTEINNDRFATQKSQFVKMINEDNLDFFRLPLTKGDLASRTAVKGDSLIDDLMHGVMGFVKYLNPKYTLTRIKNAGEQFANELDRQSKHKLSDEQFFTMTNEFDRGRSLDERLEFIKHPLGENNPMGSEYFERNLETLLYKHRCAYALKDRVDEGTPLIKAALIYLTNLGAEQGKSYEAEIKYIRDFYQNKIKGESIEDPRLKATTKALTKLREAASLMTLGIAPVQFFYQLLDGIWKDISLIIRKPDITTFDQDQSAFTFNNLSSALKSALSDLFHMDSPTVCSLLNELYGLNDMDMNVYYDRIKSDKYGLYNWRSWAFWTASRPDFFNRLAIFGAQMRQEGTWEAHSIKNGRLVYDFTKDGRFNLLQDPSKSNTQEYKAQYALYYTMAQQFVKENVKYYNEETGQYEQFLLPAYGKVVALPRAYTNLQAESMKSLCDNLYGYYAHERKSMIQATTIGALLMQYRTYWSGKKNQYLEHGGVKLKGHWAQAQDNQGKRLFQYWNGEEAVIVNEDNIPENVNAIPLIRWQGDWEEGIALTITRLFKEWEANQGFMPALDKLMSDEDFGKIYKANLQQILYDSTMFLIVGSIVNATTSRWLKSIREDMDDSFIDTLTLTAANVAAKSLQNSLLDMNFVESIGQPGVSWNPFAFTYGIAQLKNLYSFATGEETLLQMLIKSSGGMRQTRPVWEWVDLNVLHGGDSKTMPRSSDKNLELRSPLNQIQYTIGHPTQQVIYKAAARRGGKLFSE